MASWSSLVAKSARRAVVGLVPLAGGDQEADQPEGDRRAHHSRNALRASGNGGGRGGRELLASGQPQGEIGYPD